MSDWLKKVWLAAEDYADDRVAESVDFLVRCSFQAGARWAKDELTKGNKQFLEVSNDEGETNN